jgi:Tfp pilus assembly protein PilF
MTRHDSITIVMTGAMRSPIAAQPAQPEKSSMSMNRREKLEALLAESPDDSFLQYALGMECVSQGDITAGVARLDRLIEQDPRYVPAWFQLAQIVDREGNSSRARELLIRGIEEARRAGDDHAEGEMRAFLEQLANR